jgi:HTH-type transcriptional regulator, glycine betaine synthesis regulator
MLLDSPNTDLTPSPAPLASFQVEAIDLFVSVLRLLGIPKSVGEIYGLLFSTEAPLALDDIASRLQLSKGSASQGMKLLRGLGAVKSVYLPGDRRDHFTAETELKKLVSGFYREELAPRVRSGEDRLRKLSNIVASEPNPEFQEDRLQKLAQWHRKAVALFPVLETLFEE